MNKNRGEQEKRIHYLCEGRIEKIGPSVSPFVITWQAT